jgi:mRNA interferase MazF
MGPRPKRGEVWQVDLGIAGKVRPALVVSAPISDADYALIAVAPHTTQLHRSSYEVVLPVPGLKEGCFNLQGLAALPPSRFLRRIGTLSAPQMAEISAGLRRWLPER